MAKFLLFTTGSGTADPLNWDSTEAAIYPIDTFQGIKPYDARTLDLFFKTINGKEIVSLYIKNNTHARVASAIANAIANANSSVVSIANVDNGTFITPDVYGIKITAQENHIVTLTNNSRTNITPPRDSYTKVWITNLSSSTNDLALELHDGDAYTYINRKISFAPQRGLILDQDEFSFDRSLYTIHATASQASGHLIFTYIF